MNVKFHKNCENTGKILKISCERCTCNYENNLTFIFSGSHKFSLVLLQMTNTSLTLEKFKKESNI